MDNIGRSPHHQPQAIRETQMPAPQPAMVGVGPERRGRHQKLSLWLKFSEVVLLFAGTVLVVAILFGIYQGGPTESKYINNSKFQAVFLNGGVSNGQIIYSTYFGHITALNNQFLVLSDVYYITSSAATSQASSASSAQLTKLGCQQIHAPYDQMIINRGQVSFWENLQDSGQVVQAIQKYQKNNPNGPNCSQTSTNTTPTSTNGSGSATSNTTTNSTSNTATTPPATTPTNSTTNSTTNTATNTTTNTTKP